MPHRVPLKSKLSPSVSKPQNNTGQRREALRKRREGLPVVDVTAHTVHIASYRYDIFLRIGTCKSFYERIGAFLKSEQLGITLSKWWHKYNYSRSCASIHVKYTWNIRDTVHLFNLSIFTQQPMHMAMLHRLHGNPAFDVGIGSSGCDVEKWDPGSGNEDIFFSFIHLKESTSSHVDPSGNLHDNVRNLRTGLFWMGDWDTWSFEGNK